MTRAFVWLSAVQALGESQNEVCCENSLFSPDGLPCSTWQLLGCAPDCLLGLALCGLCLALYRLWRALHCFLCLLGGRSHDYFWSILQQIQRALDHLMLLFDWMIATGRCIETQDKLKWYDLLGSAFAISVFCIASFSASDWSIIAKAGNSRGQPNALERRACRSCSPAASRPGMMIAAPFWRLSDAPGWRPV